MNKPVTDIDLAVVACAILFALLIHGIASGMAEERIHTKLDAICEAVPECWPHEQPTGTRGEGR